MTDHSSGVLPMLFGVGLVIFVAGAAVGADVVLLLN